MLLKLTMNLVEPQVFQITQSEISETHQVQLRTSELRLYTVSCLQLEQVQPAE